MSNSFYIQYTTDAEYRCLPKQNTQKRAAIVDLKG